MTELKRTNRDYVTPKTAPAPDVEGSGIRFACRQTGPSTGTPRLLL